ncbi:MAG: DUF4303 domain-containing protein [Paracoccus aminovorans]|nr:DUF4303 domain-containing protein [Paracoccus aminovorans]
MTQNDLSRLIADAARAAFSELFLDTREDFYYCTLVTTGDGLAPYPSAWSWQALDRVTAGARNPETRMALLKWSYSDSPYWLFGQEYFDEVARAFSEMANPHELKNADEYRQELERRLSATEAAMALLDAERLFGTGELRAETVILAEVIPPDCSNSERALRLNRPGPALDAWLEEAAEE